MIFNALVTISEKFDLNKHRELFFSFYAYLYTFVVVLWPFSKLHTQKDLDYE